MRALAVHGQALAVAIATVAAQIDEPLDVEADLAAKVALDLQAPIDDLADFRDFHLVERVGFLVERDSRFSENLSRRRATDPEDVGQRNFHSLATREIDSSNTSHSLLPLNLSSLNLALPLLVARVLANHAHDALTANYLALVTNLLN